MADEQGPNMEVRAFIAVVLSLAVMLGYQYFFAPAPEVAPPTLPPVQQPVDPAGGPGQPAGEAPAAGTEAPAGADAAAGTEAPAQPAANPEVEIIGAPRQRSVTLETDRYLMEIDNRGALITSLVLRDYESDYGGPLELVVGDLSGGMLALASPEDPSVAARANEALYRLTFDGSESAPGRLIDRITEIRWQWADGNGWSVDKRLTVTPDGYLNVLSVRVDSPTGTPLFITVGPGLEEHADNTRAGIYLMKGAVTFAGGDVTHVADDDLATAEIRPLDLVWGGVESNYFVALFAPRTYSAALLAAATPPGEQSTPEPAAQGGEGETAAAGTPGTRALFGLAVPPDEVLETPLYIGPKSYEELAAAGLERAVDYGIFGILARPVAVALDWLTGLTGNYGLAILLATLGVRLAFFPLSQSSMRSMRKMQQLQPQMNAIRAKYKGVKDMQKRQEMNTEVMQLYKDHGVSPLGGCLPMVLQMPVLFAFYAAISVSISSRQAPLALWIQDLSKMDPYYVLPLLMGAAMYGQQRMSPGVGDPVQQRIFRLMPIMFTFFFLTFPSGLVIYWLVNTVLGIAQQSYVNHQLGAPDATATKSPQKNKTSKGQKGGGARRKKRGKR